MGTIFQGTRIRERHNRHGKALVYTPTLPHKKTLEDALDAHNWAWSWLGANRHKVVSPKWMKDLVNRLLLDKKSNWDEIIKDLESRIEDPAYTSKSGEIPQPPPKDPLDLATALESYNRHMGRNHYSQGFPELDMRVILENKDHQGLTLAEKGKLIKRDLIDELLATGTLMENVARKKPKQIYERFTKHMSKENIAVLRTRIREIQSLLANEKLWREFGNSLDIPLKSLAQVTPEHATEYQAWRKNQRKGLPREGVKEISKRMIFHEIQYLRNILKRNVSARLLPVNEFDQIDLKSFTKAIKPAPKEKPYTLEELESLLIWAKTHWEESPEVTERDRKWKRDRELNFLTMVFLACTGCRPIEVNQWELTGKQLEFSNGKTENAARVLDITKTVRKVITNPVFSENKKSLGVSTRLGNYLKRHKGRGFTPYRFRYSTATMLMVMEWPIQRITYFLGHSDSKTTEKYYSRQVKLLRGGSKEEVESFWDGLNRDFLISGKIRSIEAPRFFGGASNQVP